MTTEKATRRYLFTLAPAMLLFLAASVAINWMDNNTNTSQSALAGMAIVPIILLLSAFWAQWRFLNEIDEYLRMIHLKALLIGAMVVIAVATTWGYLEAYADFEPLRIFWINPLFWISYGVIAALFTQLDDRKSN